MCEIAGLRAFEIVVCDELDRLRYCPDGGCGTVVPVTASDPWCCGATYVP